MSGRSWTKAADVDAGPAAASAPESETRSSGAPCGAPARSFPGGATLWNRGRTAPPGNDLGGLRLWPRCGYRGTRRGLPPLTLSATSLMSGGLPRTTSRVARPVGGIGRSRDWSSAVPCPLISLSSSRSSRSFWGSIVFCSFRMSLLLFRVCP